jgi:hypothetical protein
MKLGESKKDLTTVVRKAIWANSVMDTVNRQNHPALAMVEPKLFETVADYICYPVYESIKTSVCNKLENSFYTDSHGFR